MLVFYYSNKVTSPFHPNLSVRINSQLPKIFEISTSLLQ